MINPKCNTTQYRYFPHHLSGISKEVVVGLGAGKVGMERVGKSGVWGRRLINDLLWPGLVGYLRLHVLIATLLVIRNGGQ